MIATAIDINADVGEGIGNDALLMPFLSSCNIACGGHAGDEHSMVETANLAKTNKVKVGAHPSFPDKENFGRSIMTMSSADLYTSLKQQIRSLMRVLRPLRIPLHHVKPHGALYNFAAKDEKTARVVIEVMKSIAMPLSLYAPYGSVISEIAIAERIPVTFEAFIDRNYNEDLSLVSRSESNAVIFNPEEALEHLLLMIKCGKVKTVSEVETLIKAETFCIHGDNPEAVNILKYIHTNLTEIGVKIR
ncbi:5-oxoprolinase subunit PxpA [Winogradskyella sp. 3972H.M.0a.05]|uniref:5-oxoprolinase subunit PxpA n=1 Tax=Winogradskyella sp. 3972H.M.0a.05 TaxID=2950277 RepID=UPI00339680EA